MNRHRSDEQDRDDSRRGSQRKGELQDDGRDEPAFEDPRSRRQRYRDRDKQKQSRQFERDQDDDD